MIRLYLRRRSRHSRLVFFFFNDTATTEIYTLSLHDALPIYAEGEEELEPARDLLAAHQSRTIALSVLDLTAYEVGNALLRGQAKANADQVGTVLDRKSTRLNSSHSQISYAVFCLKKKSKAEQTSPGRGRPRARRGRRRRNRGAGGRGSPRLRPRGGDRGRSGPRRARLAPPAYVVV